MRARRKSLEEQGLADAADVGASKSLRPRSSKMHAVTMCPGPCTTRAATKSSAKSASPAAQTSLETTARHAGRQCCARASASPALDGCCTRSVRCCASMSRSTKQARRSQRSPLVSDATRQRRRTCRVPLEMSARPGSRDGSCCDGAGGGASE